jgi:uncharacterized protein with ParB-like and HNH nuclease domain
MNDQLENLAGFLRDDRINRFNIPIYQRSYEWKKQQVDQFINDIEGLVDDKSEDSYHFLGMIVFVNKDDIDKEVEIIDGQQRITSFLLFCVLILDWIEYEKYRPYVSGSFDESQKKAIDNYYYELRSVIYQRSSLNRNPNKKKYSIPKLYTDNTYKSDAEMTQYLLDDIEKVRADLKNDGRNINTTKSPLTLRNKLFNPEKGNKAIINDLNIRTAKSRPVFKNQNYFAEWFRKNIVSIEKKNDRFDKLCKLAEVVLTKVKIIPFKTENHTEAFTLFEVLNDRGLQVSQADLLKNLCIRRGNSKEEKQELYDCWQEVIDNNLSENNKITFFRTAYNSRNSFIRQKDVYKSYKSLIDSKNVKSIKKYINEDINLDVLNYNICILESGDSKIDLQSNLEKYIALLHYSDTVQWRSILLSVLRKYNDPKTNREKQSKLVDIVAEVFEIIFSLVADKNARFNIIETTFPAYAKEINDSDIYYLILQKIQEFKTSKGLTYEKINIDEGEFENNKFCALILLMHRFNMDKEAVKNKKWTVEHILPQKPNKKDWEASYPDLFVKDNKVKDEAFEKNVYNIGNMILVDDKQNKSLGNLSFEKKQKKLIANNVVDVINEKSEYNYRNVKEWTPKVITQRKKEIKININKTFKGIKF